MWQAVELTSGLILEDLPDVTVQGPLRHAIGQYDPATVLLPVSNDSISSKDWRTATKPGAAALIFSADDGTPIWGGYVVGRNRPFGSATVTLRLATVEAYMDRRRVRTATYNVDQNTIGTSLVAAYVTAGVGSIPGITAMTTSVVGSAGTVRQRSYLATDWKSVYSALQELMNVDGGPEWSIEWIRPDLTHITPVFQIGTRIGVAVAGGSPRATFEMPGSIIVDGGAWDESFGQQDGANVTTAYSSGEGTTAPVSADHIAANANNRPVFEDWFQPSTSITSIPVLNGHATQDLLDKQNGVASLTLKADWKLAPPLGTDWAIGDDVGYVLTGEGFPGGLTGVARCIGFELVPYVTVSPLLVAPTS